MVGDQPESGPRVGFLPPEPAGPEPDLGPPPELSGPQAPPVREQAASPRYQGFAPPQEHQQAPREHQPAPRQSGWSAPPSGGPQGAAPAWGHAPDPAAPDNGAAVAGLVLSVTAGTLLMLSVGTSSIISIVCAALGIYYSRKGRARVDRGETPKHRGVAQAGFITGIVTLGLSILATVFWLLFAIIYATDEGFRQDFDDELDGGGSSPDGFETTIRLGALAVRLAASLLR